jgi:hypothetical protein
MIGVPSLPRIYVNNLLHKGPPQLTDREKLGYNWEITAQNTLSKLKVKFQGNPVNPYFWKRKRGKGHDIETDTLEIECKYVNCTVYPSHLTENVYPRFKTTKMKVVLTNNISKWTMKTKEELTKNAVNLWNLDDLTRYFTHPSFTSIYNTIRRIVDEGTSVVKHILRSLSDNINQRTEKQLTMEDFQPSSEKQLTEKHDNSRYPVLDCDNCLKRQGCITPSIIAMHKSVKPNKISQCDLTKSKAEIEECVKDFDNKRREWLIKLGQLELKRDKCLNKRIFLHTHSLGFKLFEG